MNYQDYKQKLSRIKDEISELNRLHSSLTRDFIIENCPVKVGQVISKDSTRIRVKSINVRSTWIGDTELVQWILNGTKLTKSGNTDSRATGDFKITYIEELETLGE